MSTPNNPGQNERQSFFSGSNTCYQKFCELYDLDAGSSEARWQYGIWLNHQMKIEGEIAWGVEQGIKQGLKQIFAQNIEKGIEQGTLDTADEFLSLLNQGFTPEEAHQKIKSKFQLQAKA